MTGLIDRFMIYIGFEKDDLLSSRYRGWLYAGIIFILGITTAFLIMAFTERIFYWIDSKSVGNFDVG